METPGQPSEPTQPDEGGTDEPQPQEPTSPSEGEEGAGE